MIHTYIRTIIIITIKNVCACVFEVGASSFILFFPAMATGFRVQGAPSAIQSNVVGAGLIEGDQLGDQLPGVLQSLQEGPEASKTSTLYYNESVGKFNQPAFQRSFGAFNLNVPINRFGDSGSIEVNPDIYWKGPALFTTTFTIPYAYYGPIAYRPSDQFNFQTQAGLVPANPTYSPFEFYGSADANNAFYASYAGSATVRPRIFYSWGAAYANLRQIRLNMGGAMSYVLDHYSNFVGIMASCVSLSQRAALMKAAGSSTMIPDVIGESIFGVNHTAAEYGSIPLYSADGGSLSSANVLASMAAFGQGSTPQTGPSAVAGPVIEHWTAVVKTPHTNFNSMHQYRRPIDTRLFSSNFVIDYFTNSALDTFIDSGTGWQPLPGIVPGNVADATPPTAYNGLLIPNNYSFKVWNSCDGIFPACLYRQLLIPNFGSVSAAADDTNGYLISLINADVTSVYGGVGGSVAQAYRGAQCTSWKKVALSAGYASTYGANPAANPPTAYVTPDIFPTPVYNSVINASRLSNDQLGAHKVLQTRADLCVYYPFQHFTSQTYRVTQTSTASGIQPYTTGNSFQPSQLTPFTNTTAGGSGYGNIGQADCKTFGAAPPSYQNPLFCGISIPNNPLTCLYIMVMREKDRIALGFSTHNQYSPALYWNALELVSFSLTYSAQYLHRYLANDEYHLAQLHERVEPLVVPWRGGPVVRRDVTKQDPFEILDFPAYPGCWYSSYIYELCLVDQLPLRNEAFFQQTPGFRGELLNFNFYIKPSMRPWQASDYDFRSVIGLPTTNNTFDPTTDTQGVWYNYCERLAAWTLRIPQVAVADTIGINWNLNNDNLLVVCVFAQNALWQLNPLASKIVFARGA